MDTQFCQDIQNVSMQQNQLEIFWQHLNKQRRELQTCDVAFVCNGGEVVAHKCVLACLSEYFKVLFTSPMSAASSTNIVLFEDFSVDVVTLLLDVIYGEADIPAVHVTELLKLADFVQMQWLIDLLVENIRTFINETNVFYWHAAAKGFGFGKLKFLCECYVRENTEKFQPEDVEQFGSNYLHNEAQLWDPALNREVVILPDSNGQYILLDPKVKTATILNDNIASGSGSRHELHRVWKDKGDLRTAFVHQQVVYILTEKNKRGWSSSVYSIWKFQHVSKTLSLTAKLRESELKHLLIDDATKDVTGLHVERLFHDGQGHLYVSCEFSGSRQCNQCIFKFDLDSRSFSVGYIISKYLLYRMAYLDKYGACLVTPDFILCLDQNSFEVPGFPAEALLKLEFNTSIVKNVPSNEELQDVLIEHLDWESWRPASKNGQFYCLVDNMEQELSTYYNCILRLDMEKCSWVLCDAREWEYPPDIDDGPHQLLFHCDNTIYRHWCQEEGTLQNTSYLDEDESVKDIKFSPEILYSLCDVYHYIVVPYHVLI